MAQGNLSSSITGKATSMGIGILSPSPFGLIFGTIINDATIVFISLRKTAEDLQFFRKISYQKLKEVAIRYRAFPRYNLGANLAVTASGQLTPFLLVFFYSPFVVGYYAMAYMVLLMPSKLVSNSVSSVFYQKACEEKNRTGSVTDIVKTVHTRLISIGTLICLIIVILGPELFSFTLGDKWLSAGVYAQILAPWFFVNFISTPLYSIFNVMEKQGANFGYNVLLLITRIGVLIIGGLSGDPVLALILLSATGIIFYTWMNMFLLQIAGVAVREAFKEIVHYLAFGIAVCLPLIIAKYYSVPPIFLIIIAAMITAVYYGIIITRDPQLKQGLFGFLKNLSHKKF